MREPEVIPPVDDEDDLMWKLGEHPVAIDLFCGVGGASRGFITYCPHRGPGWDVLGIDIDASKAPKTPDYFVEWDLSTGELPPIVYELAEKGMVDIVWASPPCTFATGVQFARSGENYIPLARELLEKVEAPIKVIENVPGAAEHLRNPVQLCGSAFDLGIQKHRLFETNFQCYGTACNHPDDGFEYCIGDRETPVEGYREAHGLRPDCNLATKQVREAIPPAYVHHLVDQYQVYAPHEHEQAEKRRVSA